jgi:hypothetical protein
MRLVEVQLVRWTDRFGVFHRYKATVVTIAIGGGGSGGGGLAAGGCV